MHIRRGRNPRRKLVKTLDTELTLIFAFITFMFGFLTGIATEKRISSSSPLLPEPYIILDTIQVQRPLPITAEAFSMQCYFIPEEDS
jgi:hypothetical protein